MPRKPSTTPRKRRATKAEAMFTDTPRLISEEEKHQLILAHSARRAPTDPLQRMSLWAGVTLCVAMLLAGWWMTVGEQVGQTAVQGSDELRRMTDELNAFTNRVQNQPILPASLTQGTTSQAQAASFTDEFKSNLGIATRTQDLLSPPPAATGTPFDPTQVPGLIPQSSNATSSR